MMPPVRSLAADLLMRGIKVTDDPDLGERMAVMSLCVCIAGCAVGFAALQVLAGRNTGCQRGKLYQITAVQWEIIDLPGIDDLSDFRGLALQKRGFRLHIDRFRHLPKCQRDCRPRDLADGQVKGAHDGGLETRLLHANFIRRRRQIRN